MKKVQRAVLTWAIVMLSTIITIPNAFAEDEAAIVIVVTGDFYAVDGKLKKRVLHRRSKVFVGDTLVTGKKGRAQVRFIDGAVISLRPDSELNIQKYSYGKAKSDEGSLMSLIKGGFRTITGAIGKEKYKVITSMATIGIRGTHYEAVINNQQLFVALWDGGVTLSNNAGQINLGLGADYNFGMVQSENIVPQGQIDPPEVIVNDAQPSIAPDMSSGENNNDGSSLVMADVPVLPDSPWANESTIMPTSGTGNYTTSTASVSATGNTDTISNFAYNATVDFASASINGTMSFDSTNAAGPASWNIQFSGGPGNGNGVNGTDFSMTVDAGSVVNGADPVSGTIKGSFAGSNAGQMDGEFSVVNDNNAAINADGTFTADGTYTP